MRNHGGVQSISETKHGRACLYEQEMHNRTKVYLDLEIHDNVI